MGEDPGPRPRETPHGAPVAEPLQVQDQRGDTRESTCSIWGISLLYLFALFFEVQLMYNIIQVSGVKGSHLRGTRPGTSDATTGAV